MNDIELLARYSQSNSEEAFADLVGRHVNLVYSVALRHVGNTHQAEEITQAVFIILAKKARGLSERTVLSGWLYQTARLTAANFLRTEIRRIHCEQEAYMQSRLNETESDAWPQIAPLLDAAMAGLGEEDRNAIVLRFFESKNFKDVGAALGASEDAAKMRVNRAVEKLRKFFTKRGVMLSAAAIAATVSANSVQAAPVGLAVTISATTVKGAAVAASVTALVNGTIKTIAMTTIQKTLITATIVIVAGTGIYEVRQNLILRTEIKTLQQQQTSLAGEIQQLQQERDAATNKLAPIRDEKNLQRLRKEHLELLTLRGRVSQLANELRGQRDDQSKIADTKTNMETADADSILFSASITNRVAADQTLVLGGWSKDGMRGYLLLTPTIPQGGNPPNAEQLTVESQMVGAPESFWAQIGWADAKSETRRSALAGVLTRDQIETLFQALKETKGAKISNTSPARGHDGERMGFGFAMADNNQSGVLMGVDLYPRIAADGQSVDLEIRPSALSTNTPIHPSLKPVGQPVAAHPAQ